MKLSMKLVHDTVLCNNCGQTLKLSMKVVHNTLLCNNLTVMNVVVMGIYKIFSGVFNIERYFLL